MRNGLLSKAICYVTLLTFIVSGVAPVYAQGLSLGAGAGVLPEPGTRIALSQSFNPPILKGLKVYADNPLKFDFIMDAGEDAVSSQAASRLIKYFLASLTVPEKDLWVNLSPYEKNRIIPDAFGQTEMGRDLLAQDYILKQITASALYPEGALGEEFWKKVYAKAHEKYGIAGADIPVDTFNKVWIVPSKAVVFERQLSQGKKAVAYVVESKLKVMLESDYLAQEKTVGVQFTPVPDQGIEPGMHGAIEPGIPGAMNRTPTQEFTKDILREIVIPALETEVNTGKNFAQLRQLYNSLILAAWYKKKIKESLLTSVYVDQKKLQGVNVEDPAITQKIWAQYVEAFKKGAFNLIKEEKDAVTGEAVPRKYFSGGMDFAQGLVSALQFSRDEAMLPEENREELVVEADFKPSQAPRAALSEKRPWPPMEELGLADVQPFLTAIGVQKGDKVVDVGTGFDWRLAHLAVKMGAHYIGFDLHDDLLKISRGELEKYNIQEFGGSAEYRTGTFSLGSSTSSHIPDHTQDYVLILTGALSDPHPESDPDLVLKEALRVVKDGGRIVVGTSGEGYLEERNLNQTLTDVLASEGVEGQVELVNDDKVFSSMSRNTFREATLRELMHVYQVKFSFDADQAQASKVASLYWLNGLKTLDRNTILETVFGRHFLAWSNRVVQNRGSEDDKNNAAQWLARNEQFLSVLNDPAKDPWIEALRIMSAAGVYPGTQSLNLFGEEVRRNLGDSQRRLVPAIGLSFAGYVNMIATLGDDRVRELILSEAFRNLDKTARMSELVRYILALQLPLGTDNLAKFYTALPKDVRAMVARIGLPIDVFLQIEDALKNDAVRLFIADMEKEIPHDKALRLAMLMRKILDLRLPLGTTNLGQFFSALPRELQLKLLLVDLPLADFELFREGVRSESIQKFLDTGEFQSISKRERLSALVTKMRDQGVALESRNLKGYHEALPLKLTDRINKDDFLHLSEGQTPAGSASLDVLDSPERRAAQEAVFGNNIQAWRKLLSESIGKPRDVLEAGRWLWANTEFQAALKDPSKDVWQESIKIMVKEGKFPGTRSFRELSRVVRSMASKDLKPRLPLVELPLTSYVDIVVALKDSRVKELVAQTETLDKALRLALLMRAMENLGFLLEKPYLSHFYSALPRDVQRQMLKVQLSADVFWKFRDILKEKAIVDFLDAEAFLRIPLKDRLRGLIDKMSAEFGLEGGGLTGYYTALPPALTEKISKNDFAYPGADSAQAATDLGGIDFNSDQMSLETLGLGAAAIKFNISPALLGELQNAPGLEAVIVNIHPLTALASFLEIN
ncbi:MAG: methyltransferase domain-containing protein [Candidatus Omnitrophica bacterium]|nr:methyltransferase domain-containing protein [Candidatus Omnitrophota bacterium]